MLDRVAEMLSLGFMQRALIGGVAVAAACSLLSVFVVLKRMAFVGQGVSHAAFGGVALALLLGISPQVGALAFALGTAISIGMVSRRRRVAEDSTIGIFLAVAMALGLVFIGFKRGSGADLYGYLFGSILSILPGDLNLMVWLSLGVFVLLLLFIKELYFYVFDEEMARVRGLPVDALFYGLLVLLAVTIVVSMRLVGIILVTALLIIPGATARLLTTHIVVLLGAAVGMGILGTLVGLTAAYLLDISPGASIVLVLFLFFLGGLAFSSARHD